MRFALVLVPLSAVLIGVSPAVAQTTGDVDVNVTVLAQTSVAPVQGEPDPEPVALTPGEDNVIAPGAAGSYRRTIEYNADLTVSFTAATSLTAGLAELPISMTCAYQTGENEYSAPVACGDATWGEGIFDVGGSAESRDISIGYTILAASLVGKPAGTYEGSVTVLINPR